MLKVSLNYVVFKKGFLLKFVRKWRSGDVSNVPELNFFKLLLFLHFPRIFFLSTDLCGSLSLYIPVSPFFCFEKAKLLGQSEDERQTRANGSENG